MLNETSVAKASEDKNDRRYAGLLFMKSLTVTI